MIHYRLGNIADLIAIYPSYASEFPEAERKSIEQLSLLLERGDYKLLIAEDIQFEQLERLGFAMIYHPKNQSFIWLDYLVMERKFQGKGYGSIFFQYIMQCFNGVKGMYIEVEVPDGSDINQSRRISYYEKLGAQRLAIQYFLPTPTDMMPMYLYYYSNEGAKPVFLLIEKHIEMALTYIHYDHPSLARVFDAITSL
ncbi:GNAT family N-acetyltransferase [Fusibacter bizertensis]|uniref:GNAT family N-acetyltransferase n=1 Tax=Fusibacter bizertensis TaxID=1488331 RepID=A0ABT6NAN1_9FIRM|nr:GNAT family N-acetyltransferase [Fusibacter bizertensis]MDH8677476.1 GNAT family N-acetyltransferase [Fusibacter bizertensis]